MESAGTAMTTHSPSWRYYLDTSAFGGLVDDEDAVRVQATQRLFGLLADGRIEAYMSVVVLEELAEAPMTVQERLASALALVGQPVLQETEECRAFARVLVEKGAFTSRYLDDARHVAVAVLNDLDAVISWNFKHLVNPVRRRAIQAACIMEGHRQIDIVSPFEITDDET
ncbi:hypothetical protein ACFL6X_09790 [Candidatus Latescibacterota bacterium]